MSKLEVVGLEELIDRVNKLPDKGEDVKQRVLVKAGKLVKESMEERAPRSKETKHHMADNIDISEVDSIDGYDFVDIGPNKGDNSKFFYSKFTEWGTSTIPAQHWAEKSLKENKKKINSLIRDELESELSDK